MTLYLYLFRRLLLFIHWPHGHIHPWKYIHRMKAFSLFSFDYKKLMTLYLCLFRKLLLFIHWPYGQIHPRKSIHRTKGLIAHLIRLSVSIPGVGWLRRNKRNKRFFFATDSKKWMTLYLPPYSARPYYFISCSRSFFKT